jgi:copper chaperone CopZ
MKSFEFDIEGINCKSCVSKIENHFKDNLNITNIEVSIENKRVVLSGENLKGLSLKNSFEEIGFSVTGFKLQ